MAFMFSETLHEGYKQTLEVTDTLVDEQTAFQSIKIFDTTRNGRVLVLDDIVQLSTRDEASYSEMLAHVPILELLARGLPVKRVLIVGGGDGAIAEEVLKHEGLAAVDMAEIDPRVIELSRLHLSEVNAAAFADARFHIHTVDAFEFLREPNAAGRYDVIIADRPDPVGPAEVLFADDFYKAVANALTPEGFAVFQNGTPFYQPQELTETMAQLGRAFPHCGCYLTVTPSYIGGFMALTWASRESRLGQASPDRIAAAFAASGIATDYYTPAIHTASQALPAWIERLVRV